MMMTWVHQHSSNGHLEPQQASWIPLTSLVPCSLDSLSRCRLVEQVSTQHNNKCSSRHNSRLNSRCHSRRHSKQVSTSRVLLQDLQDRCYKLAEDHNRSSYHSSNQQQECWVTAKGNKTSCIVIINISCVVHVIQFIEVTAHHSRLQHPTSTFQQLRLSLPTTGTLKRVVVPDPFGIDREHPLSDEALQQVWAIIAADQQCPRDPSFGSLPSGHS